MRKSILLTLSILFCMSLNSQRNANAEYWVSFTYLPKKGMVEEFEKAVDDYLTEPTPADSTPLGEVPQEPVKGSIRPGWIRGPYGMNIMYRG